MKNRLIYALLCLPGLGLIFIVWIIFVSELNSRSQIDLERINQLTHLFDNLPIHPSKVSKSADKSVKSNKVSIIGTYQSDAAFDEIRKYYSEHLTQQGWRFVEEHQLKDRGRIRGECVLKFEKPDFILSIQFAGDRSGIVGWNYAVRIAYPENFWEKVK